MTIDWVTDSWPAHIIAARILHVDYGARQGKVVVFVKNEKETIP